MKGAGKETSGTGACGEPCSVAPGLATGPLVLLLLCAQGAAVVLWGGRPSPGSQRTLFFWDVLWTALVKPSFWCELCMAGSRCGFAPTCLCSDDVTTLPPRPADTEWQSGHVWQQRSSAPRQDHHAAAAVQPPVPP